MSNRIIIYNEIEVGKAPSAPRDPSRSGPYLRLVTGFEPIGGKAGAPLERPVRAARSGIEPVPLDDRPRRGRRSKNGIFSEAPLFTWVGSVGRAEPSPPR